MDVNAFRSGSGRDPRSALPATASLDSHGTDRHRSHANGHSGEHTTGTARQMLSKVPEIIIWFWVIKILCTTVGETFADWINMTSASVS